MTKIEFDETYIFSNQHENSILLMYPFTRLPLIDTYVTHFVYSRCILKYGTFYNGECRWRAVEVSSTILNMVRLYNPEHTLEVKLS